MTQIRHGRKEPYTETGIRRLPCARCSAPSRFQWSACSDGNLWRPLCLDCDIDLNRLVLFWMNDPEAEQKTARYAQQKRAAA